MNKYKESKWNQIYKKNICSMSHTKKKFQKEMPQSQKKMQRNASFLWWWSKKVGVFLASYLRNGNMKDLILHIWINVICFVDVMDAVLAGNGKDRNYTFEFL